MKQKSLSVLRSIQNTQPKASTMYNFWMLNLVVRRETTWLWKVNTTMKHIQTAHRYFWSRIYTPWETWNNKRSTVPDKWVPVTTAWRVLSLRMEERPPIWRVAVNIFSKQSQTTDKVWSSSLGVRRSTNNSWPYKLALLRNGYMCLGSGLILWLRIETNSGHWWRR